MGVEWVGVWIVASAFVLGLINLWLGVLRPWWQTREANPDARLELVAYATPHGTDQDERIIVTNHGPAVLRDLQVTVKDTEGREFGSGLATLWPKLPVSEIHPGQTVHLKLDRGLNDAAPSAAVLAWRDGRRRNQQRIFWLTWHRVT